MGRIAAIFKADGVETADRYSVSEWWLEPHTQGPGAHSHPEDDVFYVIEGVMSFFVDGKWLDAPKGSFVLVPAGVTHDFVQIRSPDWVQVIPFTPSGEIVMVKQYRAGPGKVTLEIPGGLLDPGEDPATAAARECLEETGYAVKTLRSMGSMNPNPALFTNRLHSFYALDVERVASIKNEHSEHTEVVLVQFSELEGLLHICQPVTFSPAAQLVRQGQPADSAYIIESGTVNVVTTRKDLPAGGCVPCAPAGENDARPPITAISGFLIMSAALT